MSYCILLKREILIIIERCFFPWPRTVRTTLHHFTQLLEYAKKDLPNSQREWFYETVMELMKSHINRVKEDIDWFVEKHDYRQSGAPWKNSMDAVPRGMQKLRGGHPSDKPYKTDF